MTTGSAAALAAYDGAVHELLGWGRAALDGFREATAHDPALALAHAGQAVSFFLDERFPEARAAAETARTAVSTQSARERSHVEAVALLVTGRIDEAEAVMRSHLETYPRDLAIAQRLYFIWFWQGRFPEMLALTEQLLRADGAGESAGDADGRGFLLGLHAFGLEEADRLPEAIRTAETALGRNPRDAWGVHALAHALYEGADFDAGVTRLPPAIHPCQHLGWFRNHLVWHLALMHLSRGDTARAAAMSRAAFERTPSAIAGDLHDSISLLWRQDLYGQPGGARWLPFAAIARERLNRQGLLFHAVHLAMALAAAGDWVTAERQLGMLRERATTDVTGLVGDVVVPLVEGMHAFAAGDYARATARIEPLRPRIVEMGGSRAQRDVFHDTLLEACFRAGDGEQAARLLSERVARRPDRYWTTRRSAPRETMTGTTTRFARPVLVDMFRHNTWATLGLIEFCRGLSAEQHGTASRGAYGSILATLNHLVAAEDRYYALLAGAPAGPPVAPEAGLDFLATRIRELGPRWEALAADPGPPDRVVSGPRARAEAAVVLIQAIHHGNEHRAQVGSILGEMGVEPPPLDVWRFGEGEGRVTWATPGASAPPPQPPSR